MAGTRGRKDYIATRRAIVGRDPSDTLQSLLDKHRPILTRLIGTKSFSVYRNRFGFGDDVSEVWAVRWLIENRLIFLLEEIMGLTWLDDFHKHPKTGMLRIYEKAQHSGRYSRILCMWPRGFGKSTYLTVGSNIQRILRNPEMRIGIGSWRVDLAEKFIFQIAEELMGNDYLKELYPDVIWDSPKHSPRWTVQKGIQLIRESRDKDPTLLPFSIFNLPTGSHVNMLFLDDIVTLENADSVALQDNIKKALDQVSNLLTTHSEPIHWTGTTYTFNDAVNEAQDDEKWLVLKRTCWVPGRERIEASSPTRYPVHLLQQKYRDDGPYSFAANMELNPVKSEDRVLKADWLKFVKKEPPDSVYYVGVDLAFTDKKRSDRTAIVVGAITSKRNRLYLVDGFVLKCGIDDSIEYLVSMLRMMGGKVSLVGIELIGGAIGIKPMIERAFVEAGIRTPIDVISGYSRDSAKKEIRIESYLVPVMSRGDLVITDRFKDSHKDMEMQIYDEFVKELDRFKFKGHDDILDAIVDLMMVMPPLQSGRKLAKDEKKDLDRRDFIAMLKSKGKLGVTRRAHAHRHLPRRGAR